MVDSEWLLIVLFVKRLSAKIILDSPLLRLSEKRFEAK